MSPNHHLSLPFAPRPSTPTPPPPPTCRPPPPPPRTVSSPAPRPPHPIVPRTTIATFNDRGSRPPPVQQSRASLRRHKNRLARALSDLPTLYQFMCSIRQLDLPTLYESLHPGIRFVSRTPHPSRRQEREQRKGGGGGRRSRLGTDAARSRWEASCWKHGASGWCVELCCANQIEGSTWLLPCAEGSTWLPMLDSRLCFAHAVLRFEQHSVLLASAGLDASRRPDPQAQRPPTAACRELLDAESAESCCTRVLSCLRGCLPSNNVMKKKASSSPPHLRGYLPSVFQAAAVNGRPLASRGMRLKRVHQAAVKK
jgi:hypothetical protein